MFVPGSLSCPSIILQERQPPAYKKHFIYSTGGENDQVLCEIFLHIEKSSTPSYGIVVSHGFQLWAGLAGMCCPEHRTV
jgi:hypothetical protein